MKNELSKQKTGEILKILDETIEQGPWDESNFLKVVGKRLREIRDTFANQLHALTEEKSKMATLANSMALRSGQKEIFIGLYSSDGNNLSSWERILNNLPNHVLSRPIYELEKDIKERLKSKEKTANEAYVSIYISQNDILPTSPDKTPLDKLGKPLLSLKNKALNLDNIHLFVHQSGVYSFVNGRLVKESN